MGGLTYPKPIMKVSELIKMGYTRDYLLGIYALPTQDFAWKQNVTKKNSPIMFETAKLEEYRQNQIKLEQQTKKHRVAVI